MIRLKIINGYKDECIQLTMYKYHYVNNELLRLEKIRNLYLNI